MGGKMKANSWLPLDVPVGLSSSRRSLSASLCYSKNYIPTRCYASHVDAVYFNPLT